jgi:hypothetical protein
MSMTVVNGKLYIAGIVGGRASQQVIDTAAEILLRAYQDWQNARFWRFLLKDTSATTPVTGCTATGASASVNAPSAGAFDFVNVGQTVTISAGTATLAANTTVSSITRGSDGVVTSITLSAAFGGTTNANATLTFSADIPVLVGVDEYNLPNDFNSAYTALLTRDPKGKLQYIDQKQWDMYQDDQTVQLPVDGYMTYNPVSPATQNYGTQRLKLVGLPAAVNTLRLRYYRRFITNGTFIDMPDEFLYQFLDYARGLYLAAKRAQDDPGSFISGVTDAFASAQQTDEEPDDDEEQRIKSPYERSGSRPIVGNGQFSPWPFE